MINPRKGRRYKVVVPVEIEVVDEYGAGVESCANDIVDGLKQAARNKPSFGYRLTARPLKTDFAASDLVQTWPTVEMAVTAATDEEAPHV